jgi:SPP1 gp7 family putative phage head morphogenesis protein
VTSLDRLRRTIEKRRKKRPRTRAERYQASMRPPAGAILAYRRALRSVVETLAAGILVALGPTLAGLPTPPDAPGPTRQDSRASSRGALERLRRGMFGPDVASNAALDAAARTVDANGREFQRVFKIDARQVSPGLPPLIEQFRAENVQLITSIQSDLLDQVSKLVDEAWSSGARVEDLRAKLQERLGVSKSRADLIARDQVLKLNAKITQARQTLAGVTEYIWTTSGDERVRGNPDGKYPDSDRDHYRLDGKRFRWDSPPVINEKTGERAHPGEDYQCRCVATPVISFLEDPDLDEPL